MFKKEISNPAAQNLIISQPKRENFSEIEIGCFYGRIT